MPPPLPGIVEVCGFPLAQLAANITHLLFAKLTGKYTVSLGEGVPAIGAQRQAADRAGVVDFHLILFNEDLAPAVRTVPVISIFRKLEVGPAARAFGRYQFDYAFTTVSDFSQNGD